MAISALAGAASVTIRRAKISFLIFVSLTKNVDLHLRLIYAYG
jgi:hypothetical protein